MSRPPHAQPPDARAWDLLESAPAGVVVLDAGGYVRFVNRALCELSGVTADVVVGRLASELHAMFAWDGKVSAPVLTETGGRRVFDVCLRHTAGHRLWVQLSMRPLVTPADVPDGLIAFVIDVTRERELENTLRSEAERLEAQVVERSARLQVLEARRLQNERLVALGQLAAGVAHEINNPLAGIKNALLLVRDAVPVEHPDRVYLDMIDKEVDRIGTIVRRLYEVYRPEAGQGHEVDIRRVLEDARRAVASSIAEHAVTLVVSVGENVPSLVVPPEQLLEILEHLLRNAVEASPRAGVVTVSVGVSASVVAITVADQGEGIADDVLPAIFDPFFTTKTVEQGLRGMGLGLSVAKSLVEALGGRLYVQTALGQGATFTAVLPRDQGTPAS